MVGVISNNFQTWNVCDGTTQFLTLGGWATNPATSNDFVIEGVNCLTARASAGSAWSLGSEAAGTTINLQSTGSHIFMWIRNTTWPATNTIANGGIGISISSDHTPTLTGTPPSQGPTNSRNFFLGGSDTDNTTGWVCYVVDPASTTPDANIGAFEIGSVRRIGIRAVVPGTVGAGAVKPANINWDIIKYGTGIKTIDGTGQTPVQLSDIYLQDSSGSPITGSAYGVLTRQSSIYFGAGKMQFGQSTVAGSFTTFKEIDKTIVWLKMPVSATFYEIKIIGSDASGSKNLTTFTLGSFDGNANLASNGCAIKGAGNTTGSDHAMWTLISSNGSQVTRLYNCTFSELKQADLTYNAISIPMGSTNVTSSSKTITTGSNFNGSGIVPGMIITGTGISGSTYVSSVDSNTSATMTKNATSTGSVTLTFAHANEIRFCSFTNFGSITTGGCLLDNCTFQNVKIASPISATHALIVTSPTEMSRITNCKFINCGSGIKITGTGTYTFNNLTFSGNTYDITNTTSGSVIINATNGANPGTYVNTAGGYTQINNSFNLTVKTITEVGTNLGSVNVLVYKTGSPLSNQYLLGSTDGTGTVTTTYNYVSDTGVTIRARYASTSGSKFFPYEATGTLTAANFSTTATMIQDNIA